MLLKLYLEQLSPSILIKILEEHKKSIKSRSPNEIVYFLNNFLIDFNNLSEIYKGMTIEEKEVLSYFVIQIPNETLSYRKLDNFKGKISRSEFESGINKLNRKGIIFFITKDWGNTAFIIPADLFLIWHKFFSYDVINNQIRLNKEDSKLCTDRDLLDESLYRFLFSLQMEPIPIVKNNTISKKHLNKVAEQLDISNNNITCFSNRSEKIFNIKNLNKLKNLSLLLEIAHLLELIEFNKGITVTKNTLSWHNLDKVKRRDFLEKAVCSCFKSSDFLVQNLFYLMFNLPENNWFSFNHLVKNLSKKLCRPFGDEILVRTKNEILEPLVAFGWIEKIEEQEQLLFRRVQNEKNETTHIYVQPNYEILVPYNFPHSIRLKIEQFSTLVQNDSLNRYILSKKSIIKGLDRGFSKEEIITLLKKYSTIPINNNIIQAISDWVDSYGQVSFIDVRMMKCSSKLVAKEIKTNDSLRKWIIAEISPTNFIVRKSNFDNLIKEFNIQGITPKKEIMTECKIDGKISDGDHFENNNHNYLGVYRCKEFYIENKLAQS